MNKLTVVTEYKDNPLEFINNIEIKISGRQLYSIAMRNPDVYERLSKKPPFNPLHKYLIWLAEVLEICERDGREITSVGLRNDTIDRIGELIRRGSYRDWDDAMNKMLDEVDNK